VERKEDPMPKRRYTPEEIVAKLRQVDVLLGQGKTVGEAVKTIGVTETTYHRWRNEYGGLKLDQVKRLRSSSLRTAGCAGPSPT
jgi:transposase-like protein